jgi:hypothetical protein
MNHLADDEGREDCLRQERKAAEPEHGLVLEPARSLMIYYSDCANREQYW